MKNNIDKSYKFVENNTSFSYKMDGIDNFETNISILKTLIKKGIKVDNITAVESRDFGDYGGDFYYDSVDDFINAVGILRNSHISKVVDYCRDGDVEFEVHIMPEFSRIDVIFRNYRKENDDSIDSLINESVKTR